jgi:hypothetical protein
VDPAALRNLFLRQAEPFARLAQIGAEVALSEALDAGKAQRPNNYISRSPLILDAEGQRKVTAIAERADEEVAREHRAARDRMENAEDEGAGVAAHIFGVLSFEAAWEPSR